MITAKKILAYKEIIIAVTALIIALGFGTDNLIKRTIEPLTKSQVQKIIIDTVDSDYIDQILSP